MTVDEEALKVYLSILYNILSVNEKLPVNRVQLTHDNIWFIL